MEETALTQLLAQFVAAFAPVAGTILASLVAWGSVELIKYVKSKTKNEQALSAVAQICDAAKLTVAKINQTIVPALKERAADGKLTASDMNYVKGLAVTEVKKQIPGAIDAAAHMSVTSVTTLIENQIEKSVGEEKKVKS